MRVLALVHHDLAVYDDSTNVTGFCPVKQKIGTISRWICEIPVQTIEIQ